MGGQILEYEAKTILLKGKLEQARKTAKNLQKLGLEVDAIAEMIEVEVKLVRQWLTVNARFYVYPPKKKSDILNLATGNPCTIVYNYFYTS